VCCVHLVASHHRCCSTMFSFFRTPHMCSCVRWKKSEKSVKKSTKIEEEKNREVERGCLVVCVTKCLISVISSWLWFWTATFSPGYTVCFSTIAFLGQPPIAPQNSETGAFDSLSFQPLNHKCGYATLAHSRSLRMGMNLGKQEVRLCDSTYFSYSTFYCNP
jgi:hypothetical protein